MFESLDVGTIVTLIITAVATFAGGAWAIIKGKLKKVVNLGRAALDVATTLEKALEDDKVSAAEVKEIKEELKELKVAWKALVQKE